MNSRLFLGKYDYQILWRFFDGVSDAIASRMNFGSPANEENLTFLLCELMDQNLVSNHVLKYSFSQTKEDLEKSDTGITIQLGFETREHNKSFESNYSGSDIGIIFEVRHPLFGQSERAILLQAKKLFPKPKREFYDLDSNYRHFDHKQFTFLRSLNSTLDLGNSIFYLLYNPSSSGFDEQYQSTIRAWEASTASDIFYRGYHPVIDFHIRNESQHPTKDFNMIREQFESEKEWRANQPAARISGINAMEDLVTLNTPPSLQDFYRAKAESSPFHSSFVFSPFADLLAQGLCDRRIGSDNVDFLRLARGEKISMSKMNIPGLALDGVQEISPPKHTIRIVVESTISNLQ
jgi:hypothetical protein